MTARPDTADADRDLAAFVLQQGQEACEAVLAEARGRAAEIVGEAHARARARLAAVKRQERARADGLRRRAEARVQARLEARRRQIMGTRLAEARTRFAAVLEEFWRDAPLRDAWMRAAAARAKAVFAGGGWTVELCGPETPELAGLLRGLVPPGTALQWSAPGRGGLRIVCDDAALDATVEGFLAQGARVDALLLAALEDQTQGGG